MKEVSKIIRLTADVVDDDGSVSNISAVKEVSEKYYSIKNLNMRINYMDLIDYQAQICNSSKDIKLFGDLFRVLDRYNRLNINISKWSKKNGYSRSKVNMLLKKALDCKFIIKEEVGVYFINPFVMRGLAFKSNDSFEQVQQEWNKAIAP